MSSLTHELEIGLLVFLVCFYLLFVFILFSSPCLSSINSLLVAPLSWSISWTYHRTDRTRKTATVSSGLDLHHVRFVFLLLFSVSFFLFFLSLFCFSTLVLLCFFSPPFFSLFSSAHKNTMDMFLVILGYKRHGMVYRNLWVPFPSRDLRDTAVRAISYQLVVCFLPWRCFFVIYYFVSTACLMIKSGIWREWAINNVNHYHPQDHHSNTYNIIRTGTIL